MVEEVNRWVPSIKLVPKDTFLLVDYRAMSMKMKITSRFCANSWFAQIFTLLFLTMFEKLTKQRQILSIILKMFLFSNSPLNSHLFGLWKCQKKWSVAKVMIIWKLSPKMPIFQGNSPKFRILGEFFTFFGHFSQNPKTFITLATDHFFWHFQSPNRWEINGEFYSSGEMTILLDNFSRKCLIFGTFSGRPLKKNVPIHHFLKIGSCFWFKWS